MYIRVLGSMAIEGSGGEQLDLKGLRQRAVLAVLLIEAGRPVSVDRLAELVWEGEPPRQAAGTLQAYVSRLRRVLEPDREGRTKEWEILQTAGTGYRLVVDPDSMDALQFEARCRLASEKSDSDECDEALRLLDSALALWRGEPYADFRYFSFSRSEASRLEEVRWSAIELRAELLLERGEHRQLVSELTEQVDAAPYRERMRELLMLALYRSGRQAEALACYQHGRRILDEDLGLEPGPELQSLESAIIRQDPELALGAGARKIPEVHGLAQPGRSPVAAAEEHPARPPMLGREKELARALVLIRRVRSAGGGLLLITGEAGIGKTRLAEETARAANAEGLRTFWGHCPEMEGAPPFWPWVQVARQLRTMSADGGDIPLALRFEEHAGPGSKGSAADRGAFALYEEVKTWLERESASAPLLIVIEDLHWADTASVRLLRHLTGGVGIPGLVVLATSRDDHASPALADLLAETTRSPSGQRVQLEHLPRDAVAELVHAIQGETVSPQALDALFERSGGNPFFLTELVRLGSSGGATVPEGVQAVLARRLAQVSDPCGGMLRVAACHPDEFVPALLADVLDCTQGEVIDLVDEALALRALKESADRVGQFRFSHPLLRDAVIAGMPRSLRADLHRRVAETIEARSGVGPGVRGTVDDETVSALAHHYSEAAAISGSVGEAARWNRRAAVRDLARGAPEDARDRMLRTLDLVRGHGARDEAMVVDLLIVLARSERHIGMDTGRPVIAEAMEMARRLDDPARVVEAALVLNTDTLSFTATFGQADEQIVDLLWWALPKIGPDHPAAAVAGAYVLANELIFADDEVEGPDELAPAPMVVTGRERTGPARADALTRRAIELAADMSDARVVLLALESRWLAIWGPGTLEERQALVDQMQARASQGAVHPGRPLILAWATALEAADRAGTDAIVEAASDLVAATPTPGLRVFFGWRRSLRVILDGRFEEAESTVSATYEDTGRFHPREAFDAFSGQLALIYWLSGRLHELQPMIARAIVDQPYLAAAFGPALALAQLSGGQPDEARATLHKLQLTDRETAPAAMSRSGTTATFAVAAAELGDQDLVATALRFLGPAESSSPAIVDHLGVFYMGARSAHRGRLQLSAGDVQDAVASLEDGLAVDNRMRAVPFVIKDELDLARALIKRQSAGDRERADELLQHAAGEAEAHSLVADAERALDLARVMRKPMH